MWRATPTTTTTIIAKLLHITTIIIIIIMCRQQHNHNDINNNSKYTYANTKAKTSELCCSGTNRLLISDFGSSTRGERHNSYNANHPQYSAHLVVQTQFLNAMVGPNLSPPWSDPNFNCLPLRKTTQLSVYMAQSQLPTDCLRHDVIHTPGTFPIWGLLWQLWLPYPLCASVNCTQCYSPELRAE